MNCSGIIAAAAVALAASGSIAAQTRSVGAVFAPDRSGISWQNSVDSTTFWNLDIAVDYGGRMLGQPYLPGARISVGYNFILWEKSGRAGHSMAYAGPGICAGYLPDKGYAHGGMAGISGNAGYEYSFRCPVTLTLSISPTLGIHLHNADRGLQLATFRNGLLWSLAPQAGIRYRIGAGGGHKNFKYDTPGTIENEKTTGYRAVKLTFGVEWDYVSTVANIYHHNFRAQEGYRRNDKDIMIMYAGNGAILGHIGADFGRHYNLSVYAGYEGITDGFAVFPVSLRNTLLFGKDVRLPRWLCYIDAGYGFTDMDDSVCITGRAGCGYRLPLSERVKLDFLLSYRLSYAEIPFSDEGGTVSADRIMRNNNILNAISLGIGITL